MKLQIWTRDTTVSEKKENLGFDTGEKEYTLETLTFNKKKLSAFWVDKEEMVDGQPVRDIAVYIDGYYFRTPYTLEKEKRFEQIIRDNEQV